jgi:glycosyltransferase involved in cell wall biosynthesis
MIDGKEVTVGMPAYKAEKTLERTYSEIPLDDFDDIILVDSCGRRQGSGYF